MKEEDFRVIQRLKNEIEAAHRKKIEDFEKIESIWEKRLNEFQFSPAKFILIGEYPPSLNNYVYNQNKPQWQNWEDFMFVLDLFPRTMFARIPSKELFSSHKDYISSKIWQMKKSKIIGSNKDTITIFMYKRLAIKEIIEFLHKSNFPNIFTWKTNANIMDFGQKIDKFLDVMKNMLEEKINLILQEDEFQSNFFSLIAISNMKFCPVCLNHSDSVNNLECSYCYTKLKYIPEGSCIPENKWKLYPKNKIKRIKNENMSKMKEQSVK